MPLLQGAERGSGDRGLILRCDVHASGGPEGAATTPRAGHTGSLSRASSRSFGAT